MRGKLLFVVGLATGYVLGTRAGRQRYEQIKTGAQKIWNLPPVQSGVQSLQDFTGARVDKLQSKVVSSAKKAVASALKLDETDYPKPNKTNKTDAPAAAASTSRTTTAAKRPAAGTTAGKSTASGSTASKSTPSKSTKSPSTAETDD